MEMIIRGQQHCCVTQRVGPRWQAGCLEKDVPKYLSDTEKSSHG